jgi:hypothetical protein
MDIASPLSGNGTVVPGIRLHRQQPVTIFTSVKKLNSKQISAFREYIAETTLSFLLSLSLSLSQLSLHDSTSGVGHFSVS